LKMNHRDRRGMENMVIDRIKRPYSLAATHRASCLSPLLCGLCGLCGSMKGNR